MKKKNPIPFSDSRKRVGGWGGLPESRQFGTGPAFTETEHHFYIMLYWLSEEQPPPPHPTPTIKQFPPSMCFIYLFIFPSSMLVTKGANGGEGEA